MSTSGNGSDAVSGLSPEAYNTFVRAAAQEAHAAVQPVYALARSAAIHAEQAENIGRQALDEIRTNRRASTRRNAQVDASVAQIAASNAQLQVGVFEILARLGAGEERDRTIASELAEARQVAAEAKRAAQHATERAEVTGSTALAEIREVAARAARPTSADEIVVDAARAFIGEQRAARAQTVAIQAKVAEEQLAARQERRALFVAGLKKVGAIAGVPILTAIATAAAILIAKGC